MNIEDLNKTMETEVTSFMDEIINDFKQNEHLEKNNLIDKWNGYKEKRINEKITEITFKLIEKEGVEIKFIKKEDYGKIYPIISIFPNKIKELINEIYNGEIKKIIYKK